MTTFRPDQDDLYKILGVPADSSAAEIKKVYRKLAQQLHPDANPNDAASEERFKKINAAYDVLSDEGKRKEYDEMRRLLASGAFRPGAGQPGPGAQGVRFEDLSDLFGSSGFRIEDLFGPGATSGTTGPLSHGRTRGRDVEAHLRLTFEEAMAGVTTQVSVPIDEPCDRCSGTGAQPGSTPYTCPDCAGRGIVSSQRGFFGLSRPCSTCVGSGQVIDHPCRQCHGDGSVRQTKQIRVAIPAGIKDGARVRVKGRGEPGSGKGPPGDLFVKVHVSSHPLFARKGDDLTVTMKVPFETFALGGEVSAPTLTGRVTLKVSPGTPNGRTLKVKGRGAPHSKGRSHGDLLVTLDVEVPKRLPQNAKDALRSYADLMKAATPDEPANGSDGPDGPDGSEQSAPKRRRHKTGGSK